MLAHLQLEESHASCSPHPNVAFKNPFLKAIGEFKSFEHEMPILLASPCNKLFSAPNSMFKIVWPHCVLGTATWVQQNIWLLDYLATSFLFLCHFTEDLNFESKTLTEFVLGGLLFAFLVIFLIYNLKSF